MNASLRHRSNIRFVTWVYLVSFLCALCGESFAQNFTTIHPGVEYAQVDRKIGNDPVKINLLRLDLKKVRLDVHHAFDKAIGVEPTSAIAKRHGAVAAINAGFFRLDKSEFAGDAAGVFAVDGKIWSESANDRAGLFIRNYDARTQADFLHLRTEVNLFLNTRKVRSLSGINRERRDDEIIAYTPAFGETTLTKNGT